MNQCQVSSFLLNLRVLAITIVLGSIVGLYCLYRVGSSCLHADMWGMIRPRTCRPDQVQLSCRALFGQYNLVESGLFIHQPRGNEPTIIFIYVFSSVPPVIDDCYTKKSFKKKLQEDLQCGRSSSLLQQSWPLVLVCQWAVGVSGERHTLPETNSSHLKMDGWNTIVSFWDGLFSGAFAVSFRERHK